jgi:hypothetical protein
MMIEYRHRVAIWVVMIGLVMIVGGGRAGVSAADCEIPTFLETGKTYEFSIGMAQAFVTVAEIDRQACWVKGNWKQRDKSGTSWFNLRQVFAIEEPPAPPAPSQPGQRR